MSEPHKDNRHAADQIPSNQHNKSNFESNYPDGAADSTGQDKRSQRDASQLHGKEIGKPRRIMMINTARRRHVTRSARQNWTPPPRIARLRARAFRLR